MRNESFIARINLFVLRLKRIFSRSPNEREIHGSKYQMLATNQHANLRYSGRISL
jgi:hypothetical protein